MTRINEVYDQQGNVLSSVEVPYTEQELSAHLAAYRYARENAGITINGVTIQTDATSRANLLGAKALGTSIKWKTPAGFVDLTAQQISDIATAVGVHIQKCYSAEAAITNQSFTTIAEVEAAFETAYEGE